LAKKGKIAAENVMAEEKKLKRDRSNMIGRREYQVISTL
jgi:hypothetical protein